MPLMGLGGRWVDVSCGSRVVGVGAGWWVVGVGVWVSWLGCWGRRQSAYRTCFPYFRKESQFFQVIFLEKNIFQNILTNQIWKKIENIFSIPNTPLKEKTAGMYFHYFFIANWEIKRVQVLKQILEAGTCRRTRLETCSLI